MLFSNSNPLLSQPSSPPPHGVKRAVILVGTVFLLFLLVILMFGYYPNRSTFTDKDFLNYFFPISIGFLSGSIIIWLTYPSTFSHKTQLENNYRYLWFALFFSATFFIRFFAETGALSITFSYPWFFAWLQLIILCALIAYLFFFWAFQNGIKHHLEKSPSSPSLIK